MRILVRRCDITDNDKNDRILKGISTVLAALSLIIPFVIFYRTMAATLSFWDCGEFIAAANILGNPHPPGTPFFVILGRFFIILQMFENIAVRTNIISVISSAITAYIAYFMLVRISRRMPFGGNGSEFLGQVGIRIGAFSASLILAFSSTFWFNAVETEAYGLSMLLMMLSVFLAIKWADEKENGGSDKLIVIITYLLYLSIGIHLTGFLVVPAFVIYFALVDRTKLRDPLYWISWAVLFSVAVPFYFMLGILIPWVHQNSYMIWLVLMIVMVLATGFLAYRNRHMAGTGRINYSLAFALFVVAILGYSTHIYIPIRAVQKPAINENDPSTWKKFVAFLERKQYGQESMITRMFYRRGKLSNQFGDHAHMGFGGYFLVQYASDAAGGLLRIFLFAIGAFGLICGGYYAIQKFKIHPTILIFVLFLLGSVMLVFYMNFADGTRPDPNNPGNLIQLEVRERDYFFTPGFILFATLIGTGMTSLLYLLGAGIKIGNNESGKILRYALFSVLGLGFIMIPLNTIMAHYQAHDRSKDYIPIDYAHNILNSCEKDAILFTNGDNDTFPLWYLQEVENGRKDIRIVNLSLLNTDWYIIQLKHQMGINLELEDDQIIWIPVETKGQVIYYRPAKPFYDKLRDKKRYLTPEQDPRTGRVMRVQDQMIEQIIIANFDKPIYFSGSVPTSNRWTLADRLIREGIVLKVDPDTSKPRYNLVVSDSLITRVYKYRGQNDLDAYKDDNNVGLSTTFPERFCELSDEHKAIGDTARALEILWQAVEETPFYHQIYINLQQIYREKGDSAMVDSVNSLGVSKLLAAAEKWPEIILYQQFLGVFYYQIGMQDSALERYEKAFEIRPDNAIAFRLYRDLMLQMATTKERQARTGTEEQKAEAARFKAEFKNLIEDWNRRHPEDIEARNYYHRVRNL